MKYYEYLAKRDNLGKWSLDKLDKLYSIVNNCNKQFDYFDRSGWSLKLAMKALERRFKCGYMNGLPKNKTYQ